MLDQSLKNRQYMLCLWLFAHYGAHGAPKAAKLQDSGFKTIFRNWAFLKIKFLP